MRAGQKIRLCRLTSHVPSWKPCDEPTMRVRASCEDREEWTALLQPTHSSVFLPERTDHVSTNH